MSQSGDLTLSKHVQEALAQWGGVATKSYFCERDDLWELCLALTRLFSTDLSHMSLQIGDEECLAGPIDVVFVANSGINALAGIRQSHEYIAVFAGTALRHMGACHAILSHPRVLEELGDAARERGRDADIRTALIGGSDLEAIPQDPQRNAYAIALYVIGVHFMFAHELAHLILGHVEFLSGDNPELAFLEYGSMLRHEIGADRDRLLRFLEFEADTAAVSLSLPFALNVLPQTSINPFSGATRSPYEWTRLWSFAIGIVYSILHHAHPKGRTHPGPIPRYYNALMLALAIAKQRNDGELQTLADALAGGHRELRNIWSVTKTEPRFVRWMRSLGWRPSWSSIAEMDDDIAEEEQYKWHHLAHARAQRIRDAMRHSPL